MERETAIHKLNLIDELIHEIFDSFHNPKTFSPQTIYSDKKIESILKSHDLKTEKDIRYIFYNAAHAYFTTSQENKSPSDIRNEILSLQEPLQKLVRAIDKISKKSRKVLAETLASPKGELAENNHWKHLFRVNAQIINDETKGYYLAHPGQSQILLLYALAKNIKTSAEDIRKYIPKGKGGRSKSSAPLRAWANHIAILWCDILKKDLKTHPMRVNGETIYTENNRTVAFFLAALEPMKDVFPELSSNKNIGRTLCTIIQELPEARHISGLFTPEYLDKNITLTKESFATTKQKFEINLQEKSK